MSNIPEDLKYDKSHEWIKIENGEALIGITDHAQTELTDIVFVELPAVGTEVKAGNIMLVIESVKVAADVYCPVSGVVKEINEDVENSPELINQDPYGKGWLVKIETDDSGEGLLDAAGYRSSIE